MKKLLLFLFCIPFLAIAQNGLHTINTAGNTFSPDSLTIYVGDTVIWYNTGGYHNVNGTQATYPNNPQSFGNGVAAAPWSFQWVFTMPGTYDYQCDPHAGIGMTGVIIANVMIYGCTDSTAFNYNPLANIDDGSCLTYVPDNNFEAYLEANGMGNGIANDDLVSTANIINVIQLNINNLNISDLTGIEDFTSLTTLLCYNNLLTSLDVSQNTNLIHFECHNNLLTSLDLRNGNNINMNTGSYSNSQLNGISATQNPNLSCIDVDDPVWATINWTSYPINGYQWWYEIDPWTSFSSNCPSIFGCSDPTAANYNNFTTIDDSSCVYGCFLPDSIWVSDTTENSFTVSFSSIPNSTQYRVKYKETTSNTWITKYGSSSPITIENLSVSTIYDYKFKTTCGSVGASSWSPIYQITTNEIYGCMDDRALNYNPLATADDGTCDFSCIKRVWARHCINQLSSNENIKVQSLNKNIGVSNNWMHTSNFTFLDTLISVSGSSVIENIFFVASISDTSLNWALAPTNLNEWPGNITIQSVGTGGNSFQVSANPFIGWNSNRNNIISSQQNEVLIPIVCNATTGFTLGSKTVSLSNNVMDGLVLAKVDSVGEVDFLIPITQENSYSASMGFDNYNNIYLASESSEELFVGPSPPGSPQTADFTFLLKMDNNGNPIFQKKFYDPIGTSSSVPFVGSGFNPPTVIGDLIVTENSILVPMRAWDTVLLFDDTTYLTLSNSSQTTYNPGNGWIMNFIVLEFSLSGNFLNLHEHLDYAPHAYFNNKFLSYRADTIFELDTSNLSVIGTHIYTGISDVQIDGDKMIITVGNEMLIVDDNFNTIDTISMVGLYNDGAVYIHNDGGLIGDTVITATGLNMAKYDVYSINPSQQPVTCSNWMDGSVSVNPNLGISPYTYSWSTGDTTAQVDQLGMGTYSVTVTDSIGCVITDSVAVELDVAPSDSLHPEICYITVDDTTGYNKIVLKPLESSLTAQYVIYKEGSATVYSPLDTIDANTLTYIDSSSNPTVQANRYKVSAIDVCGNSSDTSDHHKTVHLTMNTGTNGEVNLIWNIYEGYQVPDYLIYRGINGSNMNMIATITGNLSSFTDQAPPTGNLIYQIRAIGQVCNPLPNAMILPDTLESNIITHLNQVSMGISFFTQDPTCPTCNDGYIIASAYGGIAPYTYFWTNGTPGSFLGGLSAGTYTVIAFDNAGNQASATVTLGSSSPVLGCTDPLASNYDPSATLDDGSCQYSPSACSEDAPTGLNTTDVLQNRATINWDNMNDSLCMVDQYRIKFRAVGTNSWTQKTMGQPVGSCLWGTPNTSKLILNLTPSTQYEYQMKAWYCGGGNSAWTGLSNFTTADDCPNVGNFTVTTPTTTKATFTWDDSNGPYSFMRIKSRVDTTGSVWFNVGGTGVTYGTFTKNKNNLTPGESYRGQARTWCDPNGGAYKSPTWSSLIFWTQPTSIRIVEGSSTISGLSVYPNPSRDIFNVTFNSESKQSIEVRVVNLVGEIIFTENLIDFEGEYTHSFNLLEYSKGVYLLELDTDNGIVNKKLILQ